MNGDVDQIKKKEGMEGIKHRGTQGEKELKKTLWGEK